VRSCGKTTTHRGLLTVVGGSKNEENELFGLDKDEDENKMMSNAHPYEGSRRQ
jgi:hypothetical protein